MTSNQVKPKICYAYMYIDACHYEPPLIYDWLQSLKRLKSILTSLENFSWWAETQLHELLIRVPKVVMFQKKYCVDLKLHADIGMLHPCTYCTSINFTLLDWAYSYLLQLVYLQIFRDKGKKFV